MEASPTILQNCHMMNILMRMEDIWRQLILGPEDKLSPNIFILVDIHHMAILSIVENFHKENS